MGCTRLPEDAPPGNERTVAGEVWVGKEDEAERVQELQPRGGSGAQWLRGYQQAPEERTGTALEAGAQVGQTNTLSGL